MCFSATASFVGGAAISSIGIASIRMNRDPSSRLFAAIPVFFGIQQVSEGVAWLALQKPEYKPFLQLSVYVFLTFALVLWPVIIPLSILLMEKTKKKVQNSLLVVGILISLSYLMIMLNYNATAQIRGFHIQYLLDCPQMLLQIALIFYLIATITPMFVTSIKRVYLFGFFISLSYFVAMIFYDEYLVSVWCFFAAMASVTVLWIVAGRAAE